MTMYGAMDAGGTSFKCAVFDTDRRIVARHSVPTTDPAETLPQCRDFFLGYPGLSAIGIASFGPLDVDPTSADYGTILAGPKSHWARVNLKTWFESALQAPVAVETDVNGALLAEMAWGHARGCAGAVYVTVGTGIGAGIAADGRLVGKPRHPEFGHIRVEKHAHDAFPGLCPVHGHCLEGLAGAPALWARYGDPELLGADHIGWEMIAFYLAQACMSFNLMLRPDVILLGGGLMQAPHIIPAIRRQYLALINDYLGEKPGDIDTLIRAPYHGAQTGLWGAFSLVWEEAAPGRQGQWRE